MPDEIPEYKEKSKLELAVEAELARQELEQKELELLAKGGCDPHGREELRQLMQRFGRA